ncbi:hypothetical protein [Rhodococcus pyridinivorans]|uniref:hypothetical protein n=1 Tax=Rhodococcus pyridinivorans TaxID=103816 RepID=UPI0011867BB6|nr:hypothetical protein [Rhodococcus pyridinivorans]
MSQATGTLLAACIAAAISVMTLISSTMRDRRTELRVSRRDGVKPYIDTLAQATWECVAIASTIVKRGAQGQDISKWAERGQSASDDLKKLRLKIRYTLPGLEGPIRTLSLVPGWAGHLRADEALSERLIRDATELRTAIDACVTRVSVDGLTPRKKDMKRAAEMADAVAKIIDRSPRNDSNGTPAARPQ